MNNRTYAGKTYAQWLGSLTTGDPVRVRFPQDHGLVPNGRVVPGEVLKGTHGTLVGYPDGYGRKTETFLRNGTGSGSHLEHPSLDSIRVWGSSPEFLTESERQIQHQHRHSGVGCLVGSADEITRRLAALWQPDGRPHGILWMRRSRIFAHALMQPLTVLRDTQGLRLDYSTVYRFLDMDLVHDLAWQEGATYPGLEPALIDIRAYLTNLPGYDRNQGHRQPEVTRLRHHHATSQLIPALSGLLLPVPDSEHLKPAQQVRLSP